MKNLKFKALGALATGLLASVAFANGRIGSGSDGLIYESMDMPSDAILSVGEFGSIEVRGVLGNGQNGVVSIYKCKAPDAHGVLEKNGCEFVNRYEVNARNSAPRAVVPVGENYLVSFDGAYYPAPVSVRKNLVTVLRLQKVALADTNEQFQYTFSTDFSDPEMQAHYLNIWWATNSLGSLQYNCDNMKGFNLEVSSVCATLKGSRPLDLVGKVYFFEQGDAYAFSFDSTWNCLIEINNICPLTNRVRYYTFNIGKALMTDRFSTTMSPKAKFISLFPGVYKAKVANNSISGIVVPIPE